MFLRKNSNIDIHIIGKLAFLIVLGCSLFASAEGQEKDFLSPSEAVSDFYTSNSIINEMAFELEASKLGIETAKTGKNVTLSSSLTARVSENGILRNTDTPFQDSRSLGVGITLRKPILDFGRTRADIHLAEKRSSRIAGTINTTIQNQVYEVLQTYADVQFRRKELAILQSREKQLLQQQKWADTRFNLGMSSRTDTLQVQSALTAANATLTGTENVLRTQERKFATLVGYHPGHLGAFNIDELLPKTIDDALFRLNQNSELETLELLVEELDAEKYKIGTQNKPRVDFTLGYTTELGTSQSFVSPDAVVAFGTLSVPLIDGGRTRLNRSEISARGSAARSRLHRRRKEIKAELLDTWDNIKAAEQQIMTTMKQVEVAESTYRGALLEQELGRRSTIDVLLLQNSALNAKVSLARSQQSLSHAQSRLLILLNLKISS